MIFYFTGTGNSLWVARRLGQALHEPVVSLAEELKKERSEYRYRLGTAEKMIFVFPVHSWGPAVLVLRFIRRLVWEGEAFPQAYAVCTCGDDCGYTSRILRKALRKRGIELAGCYSIRMPNNYILLPGFSVDPEAIEKEKLHEAPARVEAVLRQIDPSLGAATASSGAVCPPDRLPEANYATGSFPWIKSYGVYPLFTTFALGKSAFYATDACIACGLCMQICPTRTIGRTEQGRPVWSDTCVQCLACIHRCPVRAIEYGRQTQKKGRYHHPEINNFHNSTNK